MIIKHHISEFLYELFPDSEGNIDKLTNCLKEFYTVNNLNPEVRVSDGVIEIEIDENQIESESKKFKQLVSLCEASKFEEAQNVAEALIEGNPTNSEYHRLLGQIFSELGNQDEAINSLIDALRWNSKNEWALLMMGNIFSRFKNDIETALKYYDQVLVVKPNDNITLNNIGASLIQLGKKKEATEYLKKAMQINPDYPNTYHAMGLLAETDKDYKKAFDYSLKAASKINTRNNQQLFSSCLQLAIRSATEQMPNINSKSLIDDLTSKLAYVSEKEIKVEVDNSILTAAKIEYAENYGRDFHLVKYKSNHVGVEHLILHELTHLELALEARQENVNQLFTSNPSNESNFFNSLKGEAVKLRKQGVSEANVNSCLKALFEGINRQMFNTPIDLFIEDRIFKHEQFRPIQFLSLYSLLMESIEATTRKDIVQNSPRVVLSKSKIFNLINALHFRTLFYFDFLNEFKSTTAELNQAEELYAEFLEYRLNKEPSEEYELIQHWAEDLGLDGFFQLIPESNNNPLDEVLDQIEKDPLGLYTTDPSEDRKMTQFIEEHSTDEVNMAVTMYMVDALNYFSKLPQESVKTIAFEIATVGTQGIDPSKKNYSVPSITGTFSGYKMLAYYYVSWAMAIPEMLGQLQLPFDNEYELAKKYLTI